MKAGGKHKMGAIWSSETSVDTQRTTRRYIPEDGTLHNHRCENLKSHISFRTSKWHYVQYLPVPSHPSPSTPPCLHFSRNKHEGRREALIMVFGISSHFNSAFGHQARTHVSTTK
jgi:hypothetical protein